MHYDSGMIFYEQPLPILASSRHKISYYFLSVQYKIEFASFYFLQLTIIYSSIFYWLQLE